MIETRAPKGTNRRGRIDGSLTSQLDRVLSDSSVKILGDATEIGVLFSGGLDSSFLAAFLAPGWRVTLETIGVAGSPDFRAAQEGAQLLGLPWVFHKVGLDDIRKIRLQFRAELDGLREPRRGVAIAFALAVERASKPLLVCGQGADELFFGYAHYQGQSAAARRLRRAEDLNRLERDDWPLAQRLAIACGRTVVAPFLDPKFIDLVLQLPADFDEEEFESKPLLRAWARERGLPPILADRPKRALQYGSGISKLLKREDRRGSKPSA
ncbi:MAG: asparagine synthase C-terminal domain-containing protein [Thermoplasmata archaeon]